MIIDFSRHARRQMKWRLIAEAEVQETVISPERIEASVKNRINAFKHVGDKWLKVTFLSEADKIIVITVIDKNK